MSFERGASLWTLPEGFDRIVNKILKFKCGFQPTACARKLKPKYKQSKHVFIYLFIHYLSNHSLAHAVVLLTETAAVDVALWFTRPLSAALDNGSNVLKKNNSYRTFYRIRKGSEWRCLNIMIKYPDQPHSADCLETSVLKSRQTRTHTHTHLPTHTRP